MVRNKLSQNTKQVPHYGLRKLSIGVTSVFLSTLVYLEGPTSVHAATPVKSAAATVEPAAASSPSNQVTLKTGQATSTADPAAANLASQLNAATGLAEETNRADSPAKAAAVIEVPANQDGNANQQEVGSGKPQAVKLADGDQAQVTLTNDQLDAANADTTLSFSTNNYQSGDRYQIYIPKGGISLTNSDIKSLPTAIGTTSFDSAAPDYYVITDDFINSGNLRQNITLHLSNIVAGLANAGSYEKIINHAYVTKNGTKIGSFTIKTIGKPFSFSETGSYPLENVNNGEIGVDLVTAMSPSAADVATTNDNLNHLTLLYHDLPKYYQPTEIAFKVTVNNETRVLAQFDVTAAMITNNTLTLDLPVSSTSPLRALLSNGQSVNIYLTGRYNVPDQAFANGAYNTVLHHPTITLTDQNNYSITQNAGSLNQTVLGIKGLFNLGNLVKITQGYTADYVNKDEGVPAGTVTVNKERTNTGSGFQTTFTPISNIPVDNLVISLQIPDGINVHSLAMSSNNQGIKDLDPSYGIRITYTDGSTEWIKSIPAMGQITGQTAKAIRSVSVKYAHYSYDDDLSFSMSHGTNFALAKAYPNGDAVRSGDLLVLKTAFQADDLQPTLVDSAYDRLTTYKENDQSGIYMAEILGQAQQNPGAMNAGNITYEAAASAYGLPRLAHPIMYIQVPDNAIWDQSQPLEIKTGLTATWGNPDSEQLIPKSVTTFSVNGHTFLKVDLSNYPEVKQGFSVIVHYNNGLDYLTSTKHSPFMVVADNLNQNVSNVNHPIAAHLEARDQATFEALMQEEQINVQTASYNNGDDAYGRSSWTINTADGTSSETMTQGNTYSTPSLTAVQRVDGTDPTHFRVYGSLINADPDTKIDNATQVINLPSTNDGKSQFTPVLTGPVTLTDPNTVTDLSNLATITYYTDRADLDKGAASLAGKTGLTADQVTDWSQIKAVKVVFTSQLDRPLTARVTMNMVDNHIYDHVGKIIYASSVIYSTDPKQGEALPKVVIHPGDRASAKLTVTGKSAIKTLVHYVDAAGGEHYVALPDKTVTYNDGTDTMKRADFMTGAGDLTTNDHLLLPEHMVLDYAHPTIKNSTAAYAAGYPNGTAEFGQPVQYDFDGDAVVFEGKVAKQVTQNH